MSLVSLTGLMLIFYIKRHRLAGLFVALVGTIIVYLTCVMLVPR